MREQKRRFEEDMKLLDMQHEKEKIEMDQLARDLAKAGLSSPVNGPMSEPTTPPEYRDAPVSSAISRPGRFSASSVTSSPGYYNVFGSSSQLTSPQAPSHSAQTSVDRFAGHSLPGSRRNSEKEDFIMESSSTSTLHPGPAWVFSFSHLNLHVKANKDVACTGTRCLPITSPVNIGPTWPTSMLEPVWILSLVPSTYSTVTRISLPS